MSHINPFFNGDTLGLHTSLNRDIMILKIKTLVF